MSTITVSEDKLMIFTKLAKAGIEEASPALSKFLRQEVTIATSSSGVIAPAKLYEQFSHPEEVITAISIHVVNLEGVILLVFPQGQALKFDQAALPEIASILVGLLLRRMSATAKLQLVHSLPVVTTDMFKAIFDEITANLALVSENIFIFTLGLNFEPYHAGATLFFLLSPRDIERLLSKL